MNKPEPERPSLMATVLRLTAGMDALAALGAQLRARREGLLIDARVREQLDKVASQLGPFEGASEQEELAALGAIRAFFRVAFDLLEDPARACGWSYDDPLVLEAFGRASMSVGEVIAWAAPQLGDLSVRLAAQSSAFLDVGCGTAWLSIALARRFPALTITGLDVWAPALALGKRNVHASQLASRVQLLQQDVTQLDENQVYDGVWLPAPFLPHDVCMRALPRVVRALRPGGWLFFGLFGAPPDPLLNVLADLRALRAGGHAWSVPEAIDVLRAASLHDVKLVEHGSQAPLRLVVGRTASPQETSVSP